jgi:hypothetical protein
MTRLTLVDGGGGSTPKETPAACGCASQVDEPLVRVLSAVVDRLEFVLQHCMAQNPLTGPATIGTADERLIEMARWRLEQYQKGE